MKNRVLVTGEAISSSHLIRVPEGDKRMDIWRNNDQNFPNLVGTLFKSTKLRENSRNINITKILYDMVYKIAKN